MVIKDIDMINVVLKDVNITLEEGLIAQALAESIDRDVQSLRCQCGKDSTVTLIVDKSKMTALRTEISACCRPFEEEIKDVLYIAEAY